MAHLSRRMQRLTGLALALGCVVAMADTGTSAGANTNVAIDTCSGTRQTETSASTYLLSCSDHFTLANGTITSDTDLVIDSTTSLTLMNVKIVAPNITLRARTSVSIGSGVEFDVQSKVLVVGKDVSLGEAGTGVLQPATSIANGAVLSIGGAAAGHMALSGDQLVAAVVSPASDAQVSATAGTITLTDPPEPASGGGGGAMGLLDLAALLAVAGWAFMQGRQRG